MIQYELILLEMPGTLEWGLFTTKQQPNTVYRFKLENDRVVVEKQAYMQHQNGRHYLGGVGNALYRSLVHSLKQQLMILGMIQSS